MLLGQTRKQKGPYISLFHLIFRLIEPLGYMDQKSLVCEHINGFNCQNYQIAAKSFNLKIIFSARYY